MNDKQQRPYRAYPWTAGPWGCVGVLIVIAVIVIMAAHAASS